MYSLVAFCLGARSLLAFLTQVVNSAVIFSVYMLQKYNFYRAVYNLLYLAFLFHMLMVCLRSYGLLNGDGDGHYTELE